MVRLATKSVYAAIQTAGWRAAQPWYRGGRHNECEKFQRNAVEMITKQPCIKTHMRIHATTHKMRECARPLIADDGFEWTENFDGVLQHNSAKIYVNLKLVCSAGGAQTRTLREVYHFVRAQVNYIDASKLRSRNTYFANILEGDACAAATNKFKFVQTTGSRNARKRVFIGDMAAFSIFWRNLSKTSK